MRRALIPLAAVGAVVLVAGLALAYADRERLTSGGATSLLFAGTLLCLGTLAVAVMVERHADGLDVPDGVRLPDPHWTGPAALTGLVDLAGGLLAAPLMAFTGVAVLAASALGQAAALRPRSTGTRLHADRSHMAEASSTSGYDRAEVVAARRLAAFSARHRSGGEPALAAVHHLGADRHRIVVVGSDGAHGDAVVTGSRRAEQVTALAGLERREPDDRAIGARMRTGPYEWGRMAASGLRGGEPGPAGPHDGGPAPTVGGPT